MTAPRYEHDCPRCFWLGWVGQFDAYACPQTAVGRPTVVLRYGDGPAEYTSGAHLADDLPPDLQRVAEALMDAWDHA